MGRCIYLGGKALLWVKVALADRGVFNIQIQMYQTVEAQPHDVTQNGRNSPRRAHH